MQPSGSGGGTPSFFSRPSTSAAIRIVRPPAEGAEHARSPSRPKDGSAQICREFMINGVCTKSDCPFSHPTASSEPSRVASPALTDTSSVASLAAAVSAPIFVPKASPANTAASPPPIGPSRSTFASPEPLQSDDSHDYGYANGSNTSVEYLAESMQSFNPYEAHTSMSMGFPSDYDIYDEGMSRYFPPTSTSYLQQPLDYHVYTLPTPAPLSHNYFMPDDLREELQKRAAAVRAIPSTHYPFVLPDELQGYHSIIPLDDPTSLMPGPGQERRKFWNWLSSVYKGTSEKDGIVYTLRRIENFRLAGAQGLTPVETWSRIRHPNIVTIHEGFTTRAFGDNSLVIVYTHHPNAQTVADLHLRQPHPYTPTNSGPVTPVQTPGPGGGRHAPFGGGRAQRSFASVPPRISERTLWSFIIQLANAIKVVHEAGLAVRVLDPSKILVTGKNRVRLSACAVVDVLMHDTRSPSDLAMLQQEDLVALGRLILALCCGHAAAANNPSKAAETLGRHYSQDIKTCAIFLISKPTATKSIMQLFDLLGSRLLSEMDEIHLAMDRLESEFMSELENARLVRLLCKFGFINERPEFARDMRWSETGDRYIIKLFRDYVFHQVDEMGNPLVNMGHVLTCLSKLDAGTEEKIMLVSRDEQSCLVVSYKDIKSYVEKAFEELANPSVAAM